METSCALDGSAKSFALRELIMAPVETTEALRTGALFVLTLLASIMAAVAPTEALRTGAPLATETDTSTHVTEF